MVDSPLTVSPLVNIVWLKVQVSESKYLCFTIKNLQQTKLRLGTSQGIWQGCGPRVFVFQKTCSRPNPVCHFAAQTRAHRHHLGLPCKHNNTLESVTTLSFVFGQLLMECDVYTNPRSLVSQQSSCCDNSLTIPLKMTLHSALYPELTYIEMISTKPKGFM